MDILWDGPILDPSGYGKCSRDYVKYLAHDERINIFPIFTNYFTNTATYINDYEYFSNLKINFKVPQNPNNIIYIEHATPNILKHISDAGTSIGYTVWETPSAPEYFSKYLDFKDKIFTPSEYSKQSLLSTGTKTPITVIPHIIDFDKFQGKPTENDTFVFLYNGEFTTRKGIDILLNAFCKAFTKNDNVVLLLKTYLLDRGVSNSNYIKSYIRNLKENYTDPPNIRVLDTIIHDSDLPKLYQSCDVFVTATRGEGFGLPIAEALACEKPIIVPAQGGHIPFSNGEYSYLIDGDFTDISESDLEDSRKIYKNQKWFTSNEDSLIEGFRYMFSLDKETIKNLGKYGRAVIYSQCNPKRIVDLIVKELT